MVSSKTTSQQSGGGITSACLAVRRTMLTQIDETMLATFLQQCISPQWHFSHMASRLTGLWVCVAEGRACTLTEGSKFSRRTYLHLSCSYATPFGPAILVTQDPLWTLTGALVSLVG